MRDRPCVFLLEGENIRLRRDLPSMDRTSLVADNGLKLKLGWQFVAAGKRCLFDLGGSLLLLSISFFLCVWIWCQRAQYLKGRMQFWSVGEWIKWALQSTTVIARDHHVHGDDCWNEAGSFVCQRTSELLPSSNSPAASG